jgi:hypothetical protein
MVMLQRKKRILRITWIAVNSTGEFSFSFFWVLFISLGITFLTSFFSLFFLCAMRLLLVATEARGFWNFRI